MQKEYKSINKSVRKKDAMQLLTGKPVYTDDVTPSDALVVTVFVMWHHQFTAETVEHLQCRPVLRVLFGRFLGEKLPERCFHSRQ